MSEASYLHELLMFLWFYEVHRKSTAQRQQTSGWTRLAWVVPCGQQVVTR